MTAGGDKSVAKSEAKSFGHLMSELDFDFCLSCGACLASCPNGCLELEEDRPKITDKCYRCGLCYYQCPQLVSTETLATRLFGEKLRSENLGEYKKAYSARATNSEIHERGQDGGVVTALLKCLLKEKHIDGAVVTVTGKDPWNPVPKVATDEDEILEGAGTIYSRGQIVAGVSEAVKHYGLEDIAVVGTPCQIKAFRRMESGKLDATKLRSNVKLLVGLFCTESFSYSNVIKIVKNELGKKIGDIKKMDIRQGDFTIYGKDNSKESIPVKDLKKYVTIPCTICDDYCAELADIAVGSVGAPEGYSAVLSRTDVGVKAFEKVLSLENLDSESLENVKPGLELLERLSSQKKKNNRKEVERRKKNKQSLPPAATR